MPKLTIVVGLPGAGKSSYLNRHAGSCKCYGDVCHPHKTSGRNGLGDVVCDLRDGFDCMIEDVSFCEAAQRARVEAWIREKVPSVQVVWVFLDSDVRRCLINLVGDYLKDYANGDVDPRNHPSRFECFFLMVKKGYDVPDGVNVQRVVSKYELHGAAEASTL